MPTLQDIYLAYLDCLNRQAFDELGTFVDDTVEHNGRPFGLSGYRDMLKTTLPTFPTCGSRQRSLSVTRHGLPPGFRSIARPNPPS